MHNLEQLGEFGLIELLARGMRQDESIIQGIGDDCAVVRAGNEQMLLSCDAFIEDVHFRRKWASPEDIGYKAAAAALSDIAAMGGIARYMLITLACPRDTEISWIESLYAGIRQVADWARAGVVGGDTAQSLQGVVVDITVVGRAQGAPVLRSGARPGDIVAVTGNPGCSALGLHALERGDTDAPASLVRAHLRPRPKLPEGLFLASVGEATSMIDVSDGLVQDLGSIASRSKMAIDIETDKLPLTEEQKAYAERAGLSALELAFSGGEDYELAFTLSPQNAAMALSEFKMQFKLPVTAIGIVSKGPACVRMDGKLCAGKGYNHFQPEK